MTPHRGMLRRHLSYTAVTRGKRLAVIVGEPKALAIAPKGGQARRRWSKLGKWLGAQGVAGRRRGTDRVTGDEDGWASFAIVYGENCLR